MLTMDDSLSKNVCLIGILHIVGYLFIAARFLKNSFYITPYDELRFINWHLYNGVYCVSMAALAGLMILGVIKKRHKLLAPFFFMTVVYLGFETIVFFWEIIRTKSFPWDLHYEERLWYMIGITILAIYPMYTLYKKLRSQSNLKESLKTTDLVDCESTILE